MIEVRIQGASPITLAQRKSRLRIFYQILIWWKSKTFMWNLTRKQKVIILVDGKPTKKLYVKDHDKIDDKIDKELKRLKWNL
jgi:hypothetical protein